MTTKIRVLVREEDGKLEWQTFTGDICYFEVRSNQTTSNSPLSGPWYNHTWAELADRTRAAIRTNLLC